MSYNLKKELSLSGENLAKALSIILLSAVCLSFLAPYHWLADLFSHFLIQYMIGAVVLGCFYACTRKWIMAAIMLAVLISGAVELYPHNRTADGELLPQHITIMQYNRLVSQTKHDDLRDYLQSAAVDVVILQEASAGLNSVLSKLSHKYPYRIVQTRGHAFGMVILSRYKIGHYEFIPLNGELLNNFIIRAEIYIPHHTESLVLYALHALPPMESIAWQERNDELARTAALVHEDNSRFIIMAGDWNITPYSPFFKDVLKVTELNHTNTGFYPPVSWPSIFKLPLFQIPIDHILFSPSLKMIEKKTGPSMGSDHYPLIADFQLINSDSSALKNRY